PPTATTASCRARISRKLSRARSEGDHESTRAPAPPPARVKCADDGCAGGGTVGLVAVAPAVPASGRVGAKRARLQEGARALGPLSVAQAGRRARPSARRPRRPPPPRVLRGLRAPAPLPRAGRRRR